MSETDKYPADKPNLALDALGVYAVNRGRPVDDREAQKALSCMNDIREALAQGRADRAEVERLTAELSATKKEVADAEELARQLQEAFAQERDIRSDRENLLEVLATKLGVDGEPHQTWQERLTAAAEIRAGRHNGFIEEALRQYAVALLSGELEGAGRYSPADLIEQADELAEAGEPNEPDDDELRGAYRAGRAFEREIVLRGSDRKREAQSSGIDNVIDGLAADIDSMSDEEVRAEAAEDGITGESVRRVVESASEPGWLPSWWTRHGPGRYERDDGLIVEPDDHVWWVRHPQMMIRSISVSERDVPDMRIERVLAYVDEHWPRANPVPYGPVRSVIRELRNRQQDLETINPAESSNAGYFADRLENALSVESAEAPVLSFDQLREANVRRCETAFHALDHWNPMEWGAACAGEVGEGINAAKKLRRVQDSEQYKKTLPTTDVTVQDVADEIADTVIYADLWAASMGIDLGAVVASKFNRTSDKVQSNVKLPIATPRPRASL